MSSPRAYTIIATYIDKAGRLQSSNTGMIGGTDNDAMHLFQSHVGAAMTTHPNRVGVVLIDAGESVLAEWARPVEGMEAA